MGEGKGKPENQKTKTKTSPRRGKRQSNLDDVISYT